MEFLKKLFRRKALVIVALGDREPYTLAIVGYIRADTLEEMHAEVVKLNLPQASRPSHVYFYKLDDMRRFAGAQYTWVVNDKRGYRIDSFAMATTWEAVADAYLIHGKRIGSLIRTDRP